MGRSSLSLAAVVALVAAFSTGCGGSGGAAGGGNSAVVTLTTTSIPNATTGVAYEATLEGLVPHEPAVFYVTGGALPPGLTLDQNTGAITGYPRQVGGFHVEIGVRDGVDHTLPPGRDATFAEDRGSFNINVALGPPHILPQQPPPAQYRASYGYQIDVAGGTAPYTFAMTGGTLPAGLTVNSTGFLGSFPSAVQATPYQFQVTVTDARGLTDTATLSVDVIVLPLIIFTSNPLPEAALGFPYDQTFTLASAGGGPPHVWSQAPPGPGETNLASIGMQVTPSGHLSDLGGGPTAIGTFTFTVQVTDEPLQTASRQYTLRVNLGPVLTGLSPNRASLPGPYTASGLNFQPGAVLIFKPGPTQTTVTPTFVNATTLTFTGTVPKPSNAAGSTDVMVRNPDGGSFTKTAAFVFQATTITFGAKGFVTSALSSTGLDVADVNGDGRADIVHSGAAGITVWPGSASSTSPGLHFLKNLATSPPTFTVTTLDAGNNYDCKFADVNTDGKLDIVALGQTQLKVFLGDGVGNFGSAIVSGLASFSFWPAEMTVGRLNSDLFPDVAFGVPYTNVSGNTNGRVYTMVGNGFGSFSQADAAITSMPATYGVQSLTCIDTDGDGRAEIVAGQGLNQAGTGPVFNYSALSSSAFFSGWAGRGVITSPLYATMHGCAVGDFLGNGVPAVVTSFTGSPGYAPGNFRLISMWTGSSLTTQTTIATPAEITKSMCAIDADFDAKIDWAVSTKPAGILVYKGSGQSLAVTIDASAGTPSLTSPQTGRLASGDLDGDGRSDLVATTSCWANETMANYYSTIYVLGISANGGSMGVVFYLNTSN